MGSFNPGLSSVIDLFMGWASHKKIWIQFKNLVKNILPISSIKMNKYSKRNPTHQGCKSQAWQIGPCNFCGPARTVFCQYSAKISPIFRHFFERTTLNLKWVNNKVQIFFKKSLKNTDRNKIGHDRPGPAQEISAGPKIYNPDLA